MADVEAVGVVHGARLAIHKRLPDAFWLAITTAGHDRTSLLGKLHAEMLDRLELERPHSGLTVGTDDFNGGLLVWYGRRATASTPDDEELWGSSTRPRS